MPSQHLQVRHGELCITQRPKEVSGSAQHPYEQQEFAPRTRLCTDVQKPQANHFHAVVNIIMHSQREHLLQKRLTSAKTPLSQLYAQNIQKN